MKDNVYDDPGFFDRYAAQRAHQGNANARVEVPTMESLLPDVTGLEVLDLGCGWGELSASLRRKGALHVVGVDLSEKMLERARSAHGDLPGVTFERSAIEDLAAPAGAFDLVVSSLALHYVADFDGVARRVRRWLRPGGHFVFSIEHPITTANPTAWFLDEDETGVFMSVERYHEAGPRTRTWHDTEMTVHHRPVGAIVNGLVDAGFAICALREPPSPLVAEGPRQAIERPGFLFVKARA